MANLHEVVDLGAGLDPRLADRRTIHRRVRAELHVVLDDDDGDLRNLFVGAVATTDEAVAVAADDDAVLKDDAIADRDALADGDIGMDDAVAPIARRRRW